MKKLRLPILALALGCTMPSFAQLVPAGNLLQNAHSASAAHANGSAKTTDNNASRLISFVTAQYDGASFVPNDSATISYSGSRGGDLSHGLKYDNAMEYGYSSSAYVNKSKYAQTYDGSNNILTSLSQNWNTATSAWVNNYQGIFTYDGSNNMLTQISQNWDAGSSAWINSSKTIYTYDGNHNQLTEIYQSWDAGTSTWVNNSQYINTYTSANKESTSIYQSWDAGTSAWINSTKRTNTYDAANNMLTSIQQGWTSGTSTWDNTTKDTYTYDASNNQLTDLNQTWVTATSTWLNSTMSTNSSFVGNMPQTVESKTWNTTTNVFDNTRKTNATYNSFGQVTYTTSQTWNVGGFYQPTTSDYAQRYYYETYTTGVKEVASTGGTANIYPVPASDILHIALTWNEPQAFTVSFCNIAGATVQQWTEKATANYSTTYSLSSLSSGSYIIKIQGEQGAIVKQLVVAH